MIKRTLCFSNPAYLSMKNGQMVVRLERQGDMPERQTTIPIEDIGMVVLDCQQITLTHGLMAALLDNNASVITCNERHMPVGLMLPLEGHTVQSERFQDQLSASLPLRKQLWQQTVQQKILNQAAVLREMRHAETGNMQQWATAVKSGDSGNLEGRAAAYYWSEMFPDTEETFTRDREGVYPNSLFNYGYAVLRAVIARALVSSGLLPTLGIHHHNRYNAYPLADDIMEPYRPFVDKKVIEIIKSGADYSELNRDIKGTLLTLPTTDVIINEQRSPLMIAASTTTASLAKCYSGESRKLIYPEMP